MPTLSLFSHVSRRRLLPPTLLVAACIAPLLAGCSVAGAAAGAVISVGGAVVSTGVTLTGKVVGAGIDAMSSPPEQADNSGIIVRERISPAPSPCKPAAGETEHQAPCT